jgi:hypothetical protein
VLATAEALHAPPRLRLRRAPVDGAVAHASDWAARATIIDVVHQLTPEQAADWIAQAGETQLQRDLDVLNAVLDAHRLAAADPHLPTVARRQALAARVGIGTGEELAYGRFSEARELAWEAPRLPRRRMLTPEGRLAAILTGRDEPLVCEELVLRARLDLDRGRTRHAALQLLIALDAAIAELSTDPATTERMAQLRTFREPVGAAAQAALSAVPDADAVAALTSALARVEAALRARAAALR